MRSLGEGDSCTPSPISVIESHVKLTGEGDESFTCYIADLHSQQRDEFVSTRIGSVGQPQGDLSYGPNGLPRNCHIHISCRLPGNGDRGEWTCTPVKAVDYMRGLQQFVHDTLDIIHSANFCE